MVLTILVVVGGLLIGLVVGLLLLLRRADRIAPDEMLDELSPEQLADALRGLGFLKRRDSNIHEFPAAKPSVSETRH